MYPTKEQEEYLLKLFGSCRYIYNDTLAWSISEYESGHKTSFNDWCARLTGLKRGEYKWLNEVDSHALQQALRHLQLSFDGFYKRRTGYPNFKSKKLHRDSATSVSHIRIEDGRLKIPKIKTTIKTDNHRVPADNWKLKSITLSRVPSGKYFASCLFEYDVDIQPVELKTFIGLDYAQHGLYVDSNGMTPEIRRAFVSSEEKLARAQRNLWRMKKGSNNYEKQRIKVARIHEHIANIRNDQLQKLSAQIANEYDVVTVEDLNVKTMGEDALHLGKNERDNGWGAFVTMLEYKLKDRGKRLIKADRFFPSSQICNCCGFQWSGTKDLSVRKWTCPNCGDEHDRDTNAAKNLRDYGFRQFAPRDTREELV